LTIRGILRIYRTLCGETSTVSDPTDLTLYRLTFTSAKPRPDEAPPAPVGRRLARLLKIAGRALGLKCLLVEKLPSASPGAAPAAPGTAEATQTPPRGRRRF
jgi:hypothetical protein